MHTKNTHTFSVVFCERDEMYGRGSDGFVSERRLNCVQVMRANGNIAANTYIHTFIQKSLSCL